MIPIKYIFHAIIVPGSILITIFTFISRYKNAKQEDRMLFYYLLISGLINIAGIILSRQNTTNLPLLHLYTIMEAIFLLSYLRLLFIEPFIRKIIFWAIILFPILCVINFTCFQSIFSFNTYTRPLEAILITLFCLMYLYKSGFTENWISKPRNWYNIGILIYFPVAFIIFLLSNYLASNPNKTMNTMVWNVHAALVLLMYLSWAKGFSLIKNDG